MSDWASYDIIKEEQPTMARLNSIVAMMLLDDTEVCFRQRIELVSC